MLTNRQLLLFNDIIITNELTWKQDFNGVVSEGGADYDCFTYYQIGT